MIPIDDFNYRDSAGKKQTVKILFQDESLLAVDKPPDLRVIPDRWQEHLPNLRDMLSAQFHKKSAQHTQSVWVVHRIDADTSGVVLFAKSAEAHRLLNHAFQENQVSKVYVAVVEGTPSPAEGRIDLPLSGWQKGGVKIDNSGKPAVTRYRVVERFRQHSLLEVYPETGRTHQIRVHLQAVGHPLAVDPLYHRVKRITISRFKRSAQPKFRDEEEPALISRLTLHAASLEFRHPFTSRNIRIEAELPKDLLALLKALRKWASR